MVYVVKESQGRLPQNRFTFTFSGEEDAPTFSVPRLEFLSGRALDLADQIAIGAEDLENVGSDFILLLYRLFELTCPEAKDEIWNCDASQLADLFMAWQGESEDLGKSDSSESL